MTTTFFDANVHTFDKHISIEALLYSTTTAQLEWFIDHIIACEDCRRSIGTFIATSKDAEQAESYLGTINSDLLTKITQIIQEIDAQNDTSAYIEILEVQGKEAAERRFPLLANHIKRCQACQSQLEETLTLLHRAKAAGLIPPLS